MLAPALRRHVADRPLQYLQQRLLHALAGHVPRDRYILRLARNLVDLVNIDNPPLRALHVIIRVLQQPQDDVLHVLAHIPGLGQRRRVGNRKRNVQNPRQRTRQQRLAGTRRPQHQNVAFFDLDVAVGVRRRQRFGGLSFAGRRRGRFMENPLVMIMHCDREGLFGVVLADALAVELALDLRRLGHAAAGLVFFRLRGQFLVEHALAQHHAIVADINPRPGDQLLDFRVGFPAEAAKGHVGGPGHAGYSFLSARLVVLSGNPGISLRDCTTSSTRP